MSVSSTRTHDVARQPREDPLARTTDKKSVVGVALDGADRAPLTAAEIRFLQHLVARPGEPVSRRQLAQVVWDDPEKASGRALDNLVLRLRRKLEPDPTQPTQLMTSHGLGYRFAPTEIADAPLPPRPTAAPTPKQILDLPAATVDLDRRCVIRDGHTLDLTPIEHALLVWFSARPSTRVSRRQLLVEVWGWREGLETRTVERAIQRLRAKIEADPAHPVVLRTEGGEGYRFERFAHNLGPPRSGFVGRDVELRLLQDVAAPGVVTLVGLGGIGKTRLARETARRAVGRRMGGCWFVDLSEARDAEDIGQAVARALGREARGNDATTALLAGVADALIVLDNCEDAVAAVAERVAAWREVCPRTTFLATSRVPLGLADERVVTLAALPPEDAVRMLPVDTTDAASRDELVALLDGVPLALELAAAQLAFCSCADLVAALGSRGLDTLRTTRRDAPARHATLRAALDGSWALLDDDGRAVLSWASVFAGGFDLDGLTAVMPDGALPPGRLLGVMARLAQAALVQPIPPDRRRFTLLHAVRTYAREQLGDRSEEATRRHAAYYGAEVSRRPIQGAAATDNAAWLTAEDANLRLAHRTNLLRDADAAVAIAMTWVAGHSAPHATSARLLEEALDAGPSPVLEARGRGARAECLIPLGRLDEARRDHQRAYDLCVAHGLSALLPISLGALAKMARIEGDRVRAGALLKAACDAARAGAHGHALAQLLNLTGFDARAAGRSREAEDALEEARSVAQQHSPPRTQLVILNNLFLAQLDLGNVAAARISHEQACQLTVGLESDAAATLHGNAGLLASAEGDLVRAEALFLEAIAHADRRGELRLAGTERVHLGLIQFETGRTDEALCSLHEARALGRRALRSGVESEALSRIALLWHASGDPAEARRWYERALSPARENARPIAWLLLHRAAAEADGDDLHAARRTLAEAEATLPPDGAGRLEQVRAHVRWAEHRAGPTSLSDPAALPRPLPGATWMSDGRIRQRLREATYRRTIACLEA